MSSLLFGWVSCTILVTILTLALQQCLPPIRLHKMAAALPWYPKPYETKLLYRQLLDRMHHDQPFWKPDRATVRRHSVWLTWLFDPEDSNIHLFDAFANLLWYHNIEIVAIYCVIIRADKHSIFLGPLHVVALMTESEALAQKNKKNRGTTGRKRNQVTSQFLVCVLHTDFV